MVLLIWVTSEFINHSKYSVCIVDDVTNDSRKVLYTKMLKLQKHCNRSKWTWSLGLFDLRSAFLHFDYKVIMLLVHSQGVFGQHVILIGATGSGHLKFSRWTCPEVQQRKRKVKQERGLNGRQFLQHVCYLPTGKLSGVRWLSSFVYIQSLAVNGSNGVHTVTAGLHYLTALILYTGGFNIVPLSHQWTTSHR